MKYRLELQKKKDARAKFYSAALKEAKEQKGDAEEAARAQIAEEDLKMAEQVIKSKLLSDTAIYDRAVKKDNYREALLA